jgi:hypothetical protein
MKHNVTKGGNMHPSVVKNPTPANRKMNAAVSVSTTPSAANRKLNSPVSVAPKSC